MTRRGKNTEKTRGIRIACCASALLAFREGEVLSRVSARVSWLRLGPAEVWGLIQAMVKDKIQPLFTRAGQPPPPHPTPHHTTPPHPTPPHLTPPHPSLPPTHPATPCGQASASKEARTAISCRCTASYRPRRRLDGLVGKLEVDQEETGGGGGGEGGSWGKGGGGKVEAKGKMEQTLVHRVCPLCECGVNKILRFHLAIMTHD